MNFDIFQHMIDFVHMQVNNGLSHIFHHQFYVWNISTFYNKWLKIKFNFSTLETKLYDWHYLIWICCELSISFEIIMKWHFHKKLVGIAHSFQVFQKCWVWVLRFNFKPVHWAYSAQATFLILKKMPKTQNYVVKWIFLCCLREDLIINMCIIVEYSKLSSPAHLIIGMQCPKKFST